MKVWMLLALPVALGVAACGSEEDASDARSEGPVVVYAPTALSSSLPPVLDAYTAATGGRVDLRFDASEANVAAVVEARDVPPADLLITSDVHGAWYAGLEGALRPVGGTDAVAPAFRDPDGTWLALTVRRADIVYDVRGGDPAALRDYADLAGDAFAGQLCLTTSSLAINRTVIAGLIHELGQRPAERMVRHWLANLAVPPFATEAELLDAITAGTCKAGIVGRAADSGDGALTGLLRYVTPVRPALEVTGMGVGRHARAPEAAETLLNWLAANADLPGAARRVGPGELAPGAVAVGGWGAEEAVKLAERAGYR